MVNHDSEVSETRPAVDEACCAVVMALAYAAMDSKSETVRTGPNQQSVRGVYIDNTGLWPINQAQEILCYPGVRRLERCPEYAIIGYSAVGST